MTTYKIKNDFVHAEVGENYWLRFRPNQAPLVVPAESGGRSVSANDLIQALVNRHKELNDQARSEAVDIDITIAELAEDSFSVTDDKSSFIRRLEYCNVTRRLTVYMVRGTIYRYSGVPFAAAEEFQKSESWGAFYNKNVVRQYKSEKVI